VIIILRFRYNLCFYELPSYSMTNLTDAVCVTRNCNNNIYTCTCIYIVPYMIKNKHSKALYIIINIMYRHGVNNIQCNQLQLQITYKCMIKITQIIITITDYFLDTCLLRKGPLMKTWQFKYISSSTISYLMTLFEFR
jgi:hypothetical protein